MHGNVWHSRLGLASGVSSIIFKFEAVHMSPVNGEHMNKITQRKDFLQLIMSSTMFALPFAGFMINPQTQSRF
jgi:hypothetical protein